MKSVKFEGNQSRSILYIKCSPFPFPGPTSILQYLKDPDIIAPGLVVKASSIHPFRILAELGNP